MTEEEIQQLRKEHADLKEALSQKEQRIEELEGLLMGALLRIEELERRASLLEGKQGIKDMPCCKWRNQMRWSSIGQSVVKPANMS